MIGFFILFGLVFISIALSIIFYKRKLKNWLDFGIIVSLVLILISGMLYYTSYSRLSDEILVKYKILKNKLEVVHSFPDSIQISIYTYFPKLISEVNEMNNDIRINKKNVRNPINGWLFSEDIANLEELK